MIGLTTTQHQIDCEFRSQAAALRIWLGAWIKVKNPKARQHGLSIEYFAQPLVHGPT
jgi:hypothetical protein